MNEQKQAIVMQRIKILNKTDMKDQWPLILMCENFNIVLLALVGVTGC